MTSNEYRSRGELEHAHQEEIAAAKRRIDDAEEYVFYYQSKMRSMQEDFYALASRNGSADDPQFRAVLAQVSNEVDENVDGAAAVILQSRQADELERFAEESRIRVF
jgi:hypothetical protein